MHWYYYVLAYFILIPSWMVYMQLIGGFFAHKNDRLYNFFFFLSKLPFIPFWGLGNLFTGIHKKFCVYE
jgi:hypothetical protein